MDSLNRMAVELLDEAIDFADELAIEVHTLENGATIIDFGVDVVGGIEAGLFLAEIQTGGLATLQLTVTEIGEAPLTHVELATDHPALALLCSQKAGWELSSDGFEGLGSGPARALVAEEEEFTRTGYSESGDFAVLAIEGETLPDAAVAEHVATMAGVATSSVYLPTFATASITGSVNVAARAAELAAFRLAELGYDPRDILSAVGTAPVAPIAADDATAIARVNDALAYGGQVHLTVDAPFDHFDSVPSTAASDYGRPFSDVFDAHEWDFYDMPVDLFAPAQVTIDVVGGDTHVVGTRNDDLLIESFEL